MKTCALEKSYDLTLRLSLATCTTIIRKAKEYTCIPITALADIWEPDMTYIL